MHNLAFPLLKAAAAAGSGSSAAATAAGAGVLAIFYAIYFAMIGVFGLLYCVWIMAALAFFAIWLWLLIDCLRRNDYESENDKLLWAIVIIFAGILGAGIYYFLLKRKKDLAVAPVAKGEPVAPVQGGNNKKRKE